MPQEIINSLEVTDTTKTTDADLSTIDIHLWEEVCENNASTPLPNDLSRQETKTPETAVLDSSYEDLTRTIVTPRKVARVREALEKEKEPHRCALKLLRYIFTATEIQSSNTEGSHGKASLDATKLNSLKGWF